MTETYTVEYLSHRCCSCGSFWAFEKNRYSPSYTCPRCNRTRIQELVDISIRQQRSINSLRGVINQRKTKTKKP